MIGRLFQRFLNAVSGDSDEDRSDGSGDDSVFAGSLLDWSINYGHGPDGGRGEAAREMAQIQEKAELLDEQDHYRR
ncbi:hypothetical protein NDI56_08135 [Haloarcula sp. S1CR25-12]|uniref:Uncharacterized protein n=1 Tax=Haloarcula saliterrae TaxID=2950534 RepID=A0ABU2FAY2_9EURY|nr:hypothetical protein [Haloarcula sp. S1CR25-12]MDS0259357.1 hypothetical protein [Haloarcula sp. S1CR25-12]